MQSSHRLDRLAVAFDGPGLVADAGLLLPATLAARLGLRELVDEVIDLGEAPGRANPVISSPPSSPRRLPAATASTTRMPCGRAVRRRSWATP